VIEALPKWAARPKRAQRPIVASDRWVIWSSHKTWRKFQMALVTGGLGRAGFHRGEHAGSEHRGRGRTVQQAASPHHRSHVGQEGELPALPERVRIYGISRSTCGLSRLTATGWVGQAP
jgi:hypothetical protein